jgi:MFS family permease
MVGLFSFSWQCKIILTISRIVLGTAVGGASALVPLYLAEMASAKYRSTLSTLNQLMITIGILSAYMVNLSFANYPYGWRIMLGFAALPAAQYYLEVLYTCLKAQDGL